MLPDRAFGDLEQFGNLLLLHTFQPGEDENPPGSVGQISNRLAQDVQSLPGNRGIFHRRSVIRQAVKNVVFHRIRALTRLLPDMVDGKIPRGPIQI